MHLAFGYVSGSKCVISRLTGNRRRQDTAGQEKYIKSIPPTVYRGTHGLLLGTLHIKCMASLGLTTRLAGKLVYDITNRASFDALPQWIAETQVNDWVILCGN